MMTELTEKNSPDAMINLAAVLPEQVAAVYLTSTDPENIAALDTDAPLGNVEFPAVAHTLERTCAKPGEAVAALAQQETEAPASVHQNYPPHPARNLAADGVEEYLPEMVTMCLVRTDGGTQARVKINDDVVEDYAEALREGAKMPPVLMYFEETTETFWLADGFHRFRAHRALGSVDILAIVRIGTRRDAVLHASGANSAHGLPRSIEDKRKAVTTLLTDAEWATWSDREIARQCRVGNKFVSDMRAAICVQNTDASDPTKSTRTVTRNGTTYKQKTFNIGKARSPDVPEATAQEHAPPNLATSPITAEQGTRTGIDVAALLAENAALREEVASLNAALTSTSAEIAELREEVADLKATVSDTLADNDMMGRVFDADDQVKAAMAEATRHKALMENAERMLSARSHEFNERARLVIHWKNRAEKAEKQLAKAA